jgi:ATP-dependent DNA helicase RecG
MVSSINVSELLREGEGYLVEFKESPSNLEKDICAFANGSGGTIYIGISDHGKIRPTQLTNRMKAQLQSSARNCDPPPEIKISQREDVVILEVMESPNKPVRAPDGFYLRTGASSQKLKRDEILAFSVKETRLLFDTQLYVDVVADECLDIRQVENFRRRARLDADLDNKNLLRNLGCLKYQNNRPYLTYAGILLFGREPQRVVPNATMTLLHLEDPATILEQKILKGTLFDQVENGFSFLKDRLHSTPEIKTLKREDILEVPEFVLRELLVNAVIHRDYFERSADVVVKVYKTYVEFSNPGTISHTIPLSSLYGRSFRRNPLIADLFFHANYIERAGTGLLRVRQALQKMGSPPLQLYEEGPFFIAKLPRPAWGASLALNNRQKEVLTLPADFFPFSTRDYAARFGIAERMARIDIQGLLKGQTLRQIRKGRMIRYDH